MDLTVAYLFAYMKRKVKSGRTNSPKGTPPASSGGSSVRKNRGKSSNEGCTSYFKKKKVGIDESACGPEPLNVCPPLSSLREQYVSPPPYTGSKESSNILRDLK